MCNEHLVYTDMNPYEIMFMMIRKYHEIESSEVKYPFMSAYEKIFASLNPEKLPFDADNEDTKTLKEAGWHEEESWTHYT